MKYSYKATDTSGKVVTGVIESTDENNAAAMLQDMGFIPIRIIQGATLNRKVEIDWQSLFSIFNRVTNRDLLMFTDDMSSLLQAGLPIDRALKVLLDTTSNERFRDIIQEVLKSVQGGSYLSDAIARYPKVFSDFYVNMIKAGEASGALENILERLSLFLENVEDLKDYIRSAMVYPAFLFIVGTVSIIILLAYVIPKFAVIFSDLGAAMPFATQLLLNMSHIFRSYWWALVGAIVAIYMLFTRYSRTERGGLTIDRLKLRIPILGPIIKKIEVARFARTLGTLMNNGVPILQAISLVKGVIRNRVISESLDQVHDRVKEGEKLSKPLELMRIFPSLAIQMITVGEESGKLDQMLLKIAENFEKVIRNTLKRFINMLEPLMILIMGLIVGFIVLSMLAAIFSVNDIPF